MNNIRKYLTVEPSIDDWMTLHQVVKSGEYKNIAVTYKGFKPFIEEGYLETRTEQVGKLTKTLLKKEQLDGLRDYLFELERNYIDYKVAAKLIGLKAIYGATMKEETLKTLTTLCNAEGIEFEYFEKPFKKTNMFINEKQFKQFLDSHIRLSELYEKYNITYAELCTIVKKHNIVQKTYSNTVAKFILKEDAERFFKHKLTPEPEVYTLAETLEKFGISRPTLERLKEEENLTIVTKKGRIHYIKSEIDALLVKREKIKNDFCTAEDVLKIIEMGYIPDGIKAFDTTALMRTVFNQKTSLYSIEEVYEFKSKKAELDLISQAYENEPIEAFNELLGIKKIKFSEKSPVTEKEWYEFCYTKLALTGGSKQNKRTVVNYLVECTNLLAQLTIEKELYSLYSNEINLACFSPLLTIRAQAYLYTFLIEFAGKMEYISGVKGSKHKLYDTTKLINPYTREVKVRSKEVYSYDEYMSLYDYAADMNHKNKAILEAEKLLKNRETGYHYSSAWLYILVHLTNAWRHSDILNIPTIDLNEISTNTLEALKERDLSFEEANSIVNQLTIRRYIANKTGADIELRFADDLILPVATAAVICAIIANTSPLVVKQSPLIDFGTQQNKFIPSNKIYKLFFKEFKGEESFVFQNLKMCRTVLVLIYAVLVQKGKGSAALKLAQRLRAHSDQEITNIYLQIPQKELDRLCENLFNRKQFGYIPSLLSSILNGQTESYEEETQNIMKISENLGGIYNIESNIGFVNKVFAERQLVADKIFKMGIDEVSELLFDLNTNALPSCEKHIQCFVSKEGCQKPELDSCTICPYAVPNFYALTAMVESIKTTIKEFVEEYDPSCFKGEKTRLLNFLYIEMDNFERAIQKYGKDEVFKFFAGGEDEYNSLLDLLDNMDAEEDFEKYLTYTPLFLS